MAKLILPKQAAAPRADLPPTPDRMRYLPIDERGYPIPWFVAFIDGKPDFRVVKAGGVATAWNNGTCWLCGDKLGVYKANVVGPMCGINRITSEPPQHLECAEYAVKACPFMTRPMAVRRERGLPKEATAAAGIPIEHNPTVALIYVTKEMKAFRADGGNKGVLFRLGIPHAWSFWREGRRATREEIMQAVNKGLPKLQAMAKEDGRSAEIELRLMISDFEKMLPPTIPNKQE